MKLLNKTGLKFGATDKKTIASAFAEELAANQIHELETNKIMVTIDAFCNKALNQWYRVSLVFYKSKSGKSYEYYRAI